MAETFINDYFVTFSGYAAANDLTITVSAAASVANGFRILAGSELMLVTAGGTGTTWTVTRGVEGTTASVHNVGDAIHIVLTAAGLSNIIAQSSIQYQGSWSSATSYSQYVVAYYKGSSYISIQNANFSNQPDTSPTYWSLFVKAPTSKGAWSSVTTYSFNDIVNYGLSSYISIQSTNLNQEPDTATTYWAVMATAASSGGIGVYASLPSSGSTYQCTDAPYNFIYNGSAWSAFAFGAPAYLPVNASGWVWKFQGNNTVDTSKGTFRFSNTGALPSSVYWKPTPATPYKVHARFQLPYGQYGSDPFAGMYLGNDAANSGYMWVMRPNGDMICYTVSTNNNNFGTIFDPFVVQIGYWSAGGLINIAIEDDGTTITFGTHDGFGNNSVAFTRGHTQDYNPAPDHIGFFWYQSTGTVQNLSLVSWHEF